MLLAFLIGCGGCGNGKDPGDGQKSCDLPPCIARASDCIPMGACQTSADAVSVSLCYANQIGVYSKAEQAGDTFTRTFFFKKDNTVCFIADSPNANGEEVLIRDPNGSLI